MARTYAAVEIDEDARPKGWKLMRFSSPSASGKLIKKLRERGFYANHGSLYELEQDCVRLSKIPDAEASTKSMDASLHSKESFSDTKNCQTEQAVQSSPSKRAEEADDVSACCGQHIRQPLMRPCSPCIGLLKDSIVDDWYLSDENEKTVPIMDVPYVYSDLSRIERAFLSGFVSKEKEQLCVAVEEWKLDLTAEGRLAIYVKTTKKVWAQLGKPEKVYEQTIRSVLVYMQLFSMPVVEPEVTKPRLLQYLTTKFHEWKVKPNVFDLHETCTLMKNLNLGCLFPLERRVLSRVTIEASDVEEWDADSGGKPYTFKRIKRHTTAESHATEVHGENTRNSGLLKRRRASSPDRNEESPTSKRQTRSGKGMLTTVKKDHEQCEVLSPNRSNSDHVLLSSKLNDLKKRKANPHTGEAGGTIPKQDKQEFSHESNEGFATSILKADSMSKEEASTSAVPPWGDLRLETSDDSDQAGRKFELDNIKNRVLKIVREASVDAQRGAKRGTEHAYAAEPLPSIRKLWDSTNAARRALDCLDKGGTLEEAQNVCPRESLMNFSRNEVTLREYGVSQLLPPVNKQKEIAERINYYAHDGDTVVEICSQAVDYLSLLKERLTNLGKLCSYKRYMIDQTQQSLGVKEWMKSEGLPTGSKLLICLSLSFALWGEQSNKILDYALEFKPKLIVLIAPLFNRRLEEHTSYNLIWDDAELLQTEILWPWGVMEVPSAALDKKKGASPTVFLWSRTDWTTKHRQIASRFGHLKKPVSSGAKG